MARVRGLFQVLRSGGAIATARDSSWLVGEKVIKVILMLLVGSWMARTLGLAQYGQFSYALAVVALFQGVANLSADGLVVRDLTRRPEQASLILGTALCLRLAIGIACWLTAVLLAAIGGSDDGTSIPLVALIGATLTFQAADTVDLWFQSRGRIASAARCRIVASLVGNALRIVLILGQAPLLAFAALASIEALIVAAALALAYRRHPTTTRWAFDKALAWDLLRQCWMMIVSGLAVAAYMRVDQILIKNTLGDAPLGVFAAAVQISQVIYIVPMALATALGPTIARWHAHELGRYEPRLVLVFRFFFYMGLILGGLLAMLSGPIVQVLYGDAYSDATRVLAIHAFCGPFVFLGLAHNLWLWNSGKLHVRLVGTLISGILSIALNLCLTPIHGLVAAAWIAVLCQAISNVGINVWLAPHSLRLQLAAVFFLPIRYSDDPTT